MADAVIVDDGGSTRIKRLMNGIGEMDSLLDVDNLTTPAGARGSSHDINKSYTGALIACQGDDGVPLTKAVGSFATIEVASEMDQGVLITRTGSKLTITAFSATSDPIIEAKQHKKKRRYIVANSGPILTVKVDGTLIYDVNDPSKLPTGTNRPVIYTSIVIT
jgi:hypothetical protein